MWSIVTALGFASFTIAIPYAPALNETDIEATDRLVFDCTITEFTTARAAKTPGTLDWESDGCSSSPDEPLDFNCTPFFPSLLQILTLAATVLPSCYRHDFGYRNYKRQSRFNEINKERIDENFAEDLYRQCESEWSEHICKMAATIYYEAVRAFGNTRAVQDVQEIKAALITLKALEEREVEATGTETSRDVGRLRNSPWSDGVHEDEKIS